MKVVTTLDTKSKKNKPAKASTPAASNAKSLNSKQISNNISHPVIAFFVTGFIYLFLLLISGIIPFGENSLLMSDLKAQFAPYILLFKHHIQELNFSDFFSSMTYTTVLGGGKNFMATMGYYMLSPFNWLVFLFEDFKIDYAIILIMGLKLCFSSSFMCLFLRKRATMKDNIWPLILGITYGFTSFSISYLFLIIWLDGYVLLPLLLYFIECLIEKRSKTGIIATLIVLFFANLYTAYMVGVFSFVYLVGRLIYIVVIDKKMNAKDAVKLALKFVLMAIICAMILGALILPIGMDILANRDVTVDTNAADAVQFKAIDIVDNLFLGNVGEFNTQLMNNPPFIFISLLVTISMILFFVTGVASKKQKWFYGIIMVLIYFSFNITQIDIAWQAFDKPNWFCHRFSFVFYPIFYVLTLFIIENIKRIKAKEIVTSGLIAIALLFVAQSFGNISESGFNFLVNLGLVLGYTLFLLAARKENWHEQLKDMPRLSMFILALVMVVESSAIDVILSGDVASYSCSTVSLTYENDLKNLQTSVGVFEKLVKRMAFEERHDGGYELMPNDAAGALGNFNGINIFDSSSNKHFGRFVKQFGYVVTYNYFLNAYGYTAPATDAFFSIPVVFMDVDDYSGEMTNTITTGDSKLYAYVNHNYLDMGFAADKGAMDFDFYQLETKQYVKDYFKFQNSWFKSLFPEAFTEDFFKSYRVIRDTDITLYNADFLPTGLIDCQLKPLASDDSIGNEPNNKPYQVRNTVVKANEKAPAVIVINYEVQNSGEQYFSIVADRLLDDTALYMNGEKLIYHAPESYYSRIFRLGYFEAGDNIEIAISTGSDVYSYQDFYFASVDSEKFQEQFDKINRDKVKVTRFDTGHVEFAANLEDNDILLTSIPYENGWECYVDGVQHDITVYQDAMIAVDCGSGAHNVELKFVAPGVKSGLIVSGIGIVALILFFIVDKKKKN